MTAPSLQTEKVTLTAQVTPRWRGEATFWIAYPLGLRLRDAADRIAHASGIGATCTEALRDAAGKP